MQQDDSGKNQLTLDAIAKELAAVAYDLAAGKIRVGSSLVPIGAPLFLKSKQKIKDGKAYFTLSFQAPLQEENEIPSAEVKSRLESPDYAQQKAAKDKPAELKARGAPEGKKLKKEIGKLWKSVVKNIQQNQPFVKAEADKLLKRCEDYTVFTDPPWQDQWHSCFEDVKKCLAAAANGDMATAKELVAAVDLATRTCHKKYK